MTDEENRQKVLQAIQKFREELDKIAVDFYSDPNLRMRPNYPNCSAGPWPACSAPIYRPIRVIRI